MILECNFCDYSNKNTFKFIEHLDDHIKYKNQCSLKYDVNKMKKEKGSCENCCKIFSNYYNYKIHKKKCESPKSIILTNLDKISTESDLEEILQVLGKKLKSKKLNTQFVEVSDIRDNYMITGNNNKINNNNNNNIQINLNNIKCENLDILHSKSDFKFRQDLLETLGTFDETEIKCMRKFKSESIKNTFLTLFEKLYFNEEYPENHNLYINNKQYCKNFHIFVDDKWSRIGDLDTIKDIILRLKEIFTDWITQTVNEQISQEEDVETIKDLQEYLDILKTDLNHFIGSLRDKKITFKSAKKLLKDFFDIAYKNRNTVKKTYDITKSTNLLKIIRK